MPVRAILRRLPPGLLILAIGLVLSGASNYVFLIIAGRVLGDADYAPLGALWSLLFIVAPGLFFPVEQELTRVIASRRAGKDGARSAFSVASKTTISVALLVAVVACVFVGLIADTFFLGDRLIVIAFALSTFSFSLLYLLRGLFAGSGRFGLYGFLLSSEAIVRCLIAGVVAASGAVTPAPYAFALAAAPLFVVVILVLSVTKLLGSSQRLETKEFLKPVSHLVSASIFSQALTNAAPLLATALFSAKDQALAGGFIKAYVITRIPIFLFQAVQAVILPRLSAAVAAGDFQSFSSLFKRFLLFVSLIALAGGVFVTALGEPLLRLFGSTNPLPTADLALLSIGNFFILLAMSAGQGLIALNRQFQTAIGWGVGLAAFAIIIVFPMAPVLRLEWSFLGGATAAAGVMLYLALRRPTGRNIEPMDALVTSSPLK